MPAISSLKEGSSHNKKVNPKLIESQTTSSTVGARTVYIYSLKSLAYNQKYPKRLAKIFCVWRSPVGYSNRRAVENVCYKRNSYIRRDANEILVNPKEISICDCKEMLMGTVNDAIEILGDVGAEIRIRDL